MMAFVDVCFGMITSRTAYGDVQRRLLVVRVIDDFRECDSAHLWCWQWVGAAYKMSANGIRVRYRVFSSHLGAYQVQPMNKKAVCEVTAQPMECLRLFRRGELLHASGEIPLIRPKDASQVDQLIWNIGRKSRQRSTVNRYLFTIERQRCDLHASRRRLAIISSR